MADDPPRNISVDLLHPPGRLHQRDLQDVMMTLDTLLLPAATITTAIVVVTDQDRHLPAITNLLGIADGARGLDLLLVKKPVLVHTLDLLFVRRHIVVQILDLQLVRKTMSA